MSGLFQSWKEEEICRHLIDIKDGNSAKWSTCNFWTGSLGGWPHEGRGSWLGSGRSVAMETDGAQREGSVNLASVEGEQVLARAEWP
jgi:hypothetical protein